MGLKAALTIAGSDPSGGAGIQADLKTFHQFGVYGQAAITLLTVQNTTNVFAVECVSPDLAAAQIRAVVEDITPSAAKTGALGNAAIIEAVAQAAAAFPFPLVVDPVMISKHGAPLMAPEARAAMLECLLPVCRLATPNLHEAAALAQMPVDSLESMKAAAALLEQKTGAAILVKGGHLEGEAVDVLCQNGVFYQFPAPRTATPHTHGTGCTYSAAITACLALGLALPDAVARAKRFITRAIASNPGLGRGHGPVNHFAPTTMEEP